MWKLYKYLQAGLGNSKEYLLEEVLSILDGISTMDFVNAVQLLYPKKDLTKKNPVEMATMFVAGLKRNSFFSFVDLVEGLKRGNSIK